MRIGVFGGSFDPIHVAHLMLAECCRESLSLDLVKFIPASVSPLKQSAHPLDHKHRVEMIKLAIGGNDRFELDTRELERGGISYTVDTIRSILAEDPSNQLVLLMGADSLSDIPKWKSPSELLELVEIGAIARGGMGPPDWNSIRSLVEESRWRTIQHTVEAPQLEISSTRLRERIKAGCSIRYQVPAAVEAYIRHNQLYRD